MKYSLKAAGFSAFVIALSLLILTPRIAAQTTPKTNLIPVINLDQAPQLPYRQELSKALGHFPVNLPGAIADESTEGKAGKGGGADDRDAGGNIPSNAPDAGAPDAGGNNAPNAPGGGAPQIGNFGDRAVSRDRNAPRRDNLQGIKIAKHVNALFSGFEQGAGFGFGLELTTEDKIPGVEFRGKFIISTRFYRRFEVEAYIPKLGDEQTHANIWFTYLRRTRDNFFGIGPRTPDEPATNYASEYRTYNISVFRDFTKEFQAGLYFSIGNTNSYRGKDDNDIPLDSIYTNNPNVQPITRWLPGLNTNAKLISYGVFAEYNGRNNERGLTKGGYFYARLSSFEGLKNDTFSDFGWNEVSLDGRAYVPLGSDYTSVAMRVYTDLLDPKRGSQIPFYLQPWFGGRSHGRGFQNYRFRGNNLLLFSLEPRQTVWKRAETKGLDVFVFGDAGQVWGDSRSKTDPQVLANDKFGSQNWRFGFGGGVQYRMNKSFAVRLDYGHTNERNMVYFSLSRGF
jgi:hypothetical protein